MLGIVFAEPACLRSLHWAEPYRCFLRPRVAALLLSQSRGSLHPPDTQPGYDTTPGPLLRIADRGQRGLACHLFSVYKKIFCINSSGACSHFTSIFVLSTVGGAHHAPKDVPNATRPTCVLAVRVPIVLRDALDRSLDALETRVGLKASRNEIIRHALRLFLETQQPAGRPTPPQPWDES